MYYTASSSAEAADGRKRQRYNQHADSYIYKAVESPIDLSSMKSIQRDQELSSTTLEKWSKMAEKLRSKLKATQLENERLQTKVTRQNAEIEDLRYETNYQKERVEDLEFECHEKTSRITSLTEILETRKMHELQESLLQKSMEHTEMTLSVDRLRKSLQTCEAANQRLLEEKETLDIVNEELAKKLEQSTMVSDQVKTERERNHSMLLELKEILGNLDAVTVDFDLQLPRDRDGRNPIETIKRQIRAMEQDRKRLLKECEVLRKENNYQHGRIQELHSHCGSWSTTSHSTRSDEIEDHNPSISFVAASSCSRNGGRTNETQNSPLSLDTEVLQNFAGQDHSGYVEDVKRPIKSAESASSSFSDIEAPPPQEHQELKRYYEQSLERIIRMSTELGNYKNDLEEKEKEILGLKSQLDETVLERDEARQEVEEALSLAENAAGKQEGILQAHRDEMQALQDKYDQLDDGYSRQLEELEQQIAEAEEFFQRHCDTLQQKHSDAISILKNEKQELSLRHNEEMRIEKEKIVDLNEELDVLMEIHTKIEADLEDLQKKYEEALSTIVELEDKLQCSIETNNVERRQWNIDSQDQKKQIEELRSTIQKSKEDMQEAVLQQQKLRRENELVLAKHGKLMTELEKFKEQRYQDESTIRELRGNCCDMEDRVQRAEQDSSTRFLQLDASYRLAIRKLTAVVHQLFDAGIPLDASGGDKSPDADISDDEEREENLSVHEKIRRLERELLKPESIKTASPQIVDADAQRFFHDYTLVLSNVADHGATQPLWYERLKHQLKMYQVHKAVLTDNDQARKFSPILGFYSFLPYFIQHRHYFGPILDTVVSRASSRFSFSPMPVPQDLDIKTQVPDISVGFLQHRRILTLVHLDLVAKQGRTDGPRFNHRMVEESGSSDGHGVCSPDALAIQKMKGASHKIKLAANTAKIRHEAREKEHRVVRLQYKKLLDQYHQAVEKHEKEPGGSDENVSDDHSQKVKSAVEKIHMNAELNRLKCELRDAELKVERMASELQDTKAKAADAQKKQEQGELSLLDAIRQHSQPTDGNSSLLSPGTTKGQTTEIFRVHEDTPTPFVGTARTSSDEGSFDGSYLTSFGATSAVDAVDGRDERSEDNHETANEKIYLDGGIDAFLQLQKENKKAQHTIDHLRMQLLEAKHEAEHAKIQLKRREENLRDVIREYNLIKDECDSLFKKIQERVAEEERAKGSSAVGSSNGDLIKDRNVALGKISLLEAEVAEARRIAKDAHKKRLIREKHLREVIEQYKTLSQEHKATSIVVEELREALARFEPSYSLEVRQRSHESEMGTQDKREISPGDTAEPEKTTRLDNRTLINERSEHSDSQHSGGRQNKAKAKRKAWFRDLGPKKGVQQANI